MAKIIKIGSWGVYETNQEVDEDFNYVVDFRSLVINHPVLHDTFIKIKNVLSTRLIGISDICTTLHDDPCNILWYHGNMHDGNLVISIKFSVKTLPVIEEIFSILKIDPLFIDDNSI